MLFTEHVKHWLIYCLQSLLICSPRVCPTPISLILHPTSIFLSLSLGLCMHACVYTTEGRRRARAEDVCCFKTSSLTLQSEPATAIYGPAAAVTIGNRPPKHRARENAPHGELVQVLTARVIKWRRRRTAYQPPRFEPMSSWRIFRVKNILIAKWKRKTTTTIVWYSNRPLLSVYSLNQLNFNSLLWCPIRLNPIVLLYIMCLQ